MRLGVPLPFLDTGIDDQPCLSLKRNLTQLQRQRNYCLPGSPGTQHTKHNGCFPFGFPLHQPQKGFGASLGGDVFAFLGGADGAFRGWASLAESPGPSSWRGSASQGRSECQLASLDCHLGVSFCWRVPFLGLIWLILKDNQRDILRFSQKPLWGWVLV